MLIKTSSGHNVVLDDDVVLPGSVSVGSHGYAQIWVSGTVVLLHRWLLGLATGDHVVADHINGDQMDNRRINLRAVTPTESNLNRLVKGRCVYLDRRRGRYEAKVSHEGRTYYLGTYDTEIQAESAVARFREQRGIVHLRVP